MAFPLRKPVRAKALIDASENTPAVDVSDFDNGRFVAILEADAGTGTSPTLDVKLQTSPDGGTSWADLPNGSFTQVTNAGAAVEALQIENSGITVRAVLTVGGSASPQFDNAAVTFVGRSGR